MATSSAACFVLTNLASDCCTDLENHLSDRVELLTSQIHSVPKPEALIVLGVRYTAMIFRYS